MTASLAEPVEIPRGVFLLRMSPSCWEDACHDCQGCSDACHDEPALTVHERIMRLASLIGAAS